jgi:type I restriction enzyme S subunit
MSTTTPARRLRPYPAYRDSGLPWLGEVPEHWDVKKLKRIFRVFNGSTPSSGVSEFWDGNITWVTPDDLGSLKTDTIIQTRRNITEAGYKSCGTSLVPPQSIVLSTRAPIGHLAIAGVELCTNQGCRGLVFLSQVNDVRFFFFQLFSIRDELKARGQGSTFQELGKTELETTPLICPPLPEQRAIVAYLDRKLAQIDQYIANKRRLIDLLREQKQAIINHAVTRGLDPAAPRKPSGVEWLGEIPAGWEIVPLKRYWTVIDCKHRTVPFIEEGIPVASIAEVKNMIINLSQAKKTTYDEYLQLIEGKRKPQVGDIIYSRNATVGEAAFVNVNVDFCMGQDVSLIRSSKQNQWFLTYQLRSDCVLHQLENFMVGSTFRRINVADIKALLICYPPIAEQQIIAEYLDQETEKVNTVIAQAEREIELMQEYRTTLISDVVTGKVDVRESKDL